MSRLCVLFLFLAFQLLACDSAFEGCLEKLQDSNALHGDKFYIPVGANKRLVFSNTQPEGRLLRYDPYLSLYLVQTTFSFPFPFQFTTKPQFQLQAMLNNIKSCEGKILSHQIGLNTLAHYSCKVTLPAIITDSCCYLQGIVTPHGVIEKEYLQNFLDKNSVSYSDIGLRVVQRGKYVEVSAADPFFKNKPFQVGDIIINYDDIVVHSASLFMQKILFSPLKSIHTVGVLRGKKMIQFRVRTAKRYGGGMLSDTFLERFGLYFDEKLRIIHTNTMLKKYGLHKGDRLLKINQFNVKTQKDVQKKLQENSSSLSLLFQRNKFQFFVNIK